MNIPYLAISFFLFAILQTATSEECKKFDGEIKDGKIILNTTSLCSCYKPDVAAVVSAEDKTCDIPLDKKDGFVTISLESLCGKCKGAKPDSPSSTPDDPGLISRFAEPSSTSSNATESTPGEVSSTVKTTEAAVPLVPSSSNATESTPIKSDVPDPIPEVSSTIKPVDNTTVPVTPTLNATESSPITPASPAPAAPSDEPKDDAKETLAPADESTESSKTKESGSDEEGSSTVRTPTSITANTTETIVTPLDVTPTKSSSDRPSISSTTEAYGTGDESISSPQESGEKSGSEFSGATVFLFFLCGAVVGVLLVLAVIYVRKRYHSRSYVTNDAPQQP